MINETNDVLVAPLMVFHVRVTLTDIDTKPSKAIIAIGETVAIENDGKVSILTSGVQRKYTEISYSLSQSDDEKPKEETKGEKDKKQ